MHRMAEDLTPPSGEFLLYSGPDGRVKVECRFQDETLWLTQRLMADLFGVGVPAINKHLKNIFESGELQEKEVISILETTTPHGAIVGKTQTQKTRFYDLDAIIAVGYRNNYPILQDAGKVSAMEARLKAEAEFETFRKRQDLEYRSDFDEEIRRIQGD